MTLLSLSTPDDAYQALCDRARQTALLASVQGLLEWDERTKMPPAAGAYRAEQIAFVAGEIHKRQTAPQVGEWLDKLADSPLAADPYSDSGTVVRELRRQYDKKTRLPQSLVEELSRAASLGEQTWVAARQANDFAMFRPRLERMLELKRQEAAALGYTATPYDPLLDDYEPHATTAEVDAVLAELRDALVPLVQQIVSSGRKPDASILKREYSIAVQESFGREISASIGFDYSAGRLDETAHPFCGGAGPGDVRITTRYNVHDFGDAFFSILHEAGHGMYEQGLPPEQFGLPTGEAVSLGIHESQSRLWENQVGRSQAFWEHVLPRAKRAFPSSLGDCSLETIYAAINEVQPSLIRVDADEVTYNLHILIRFELEKALIEDDLRAADLPAAWRDKYVHYLGVAPETDADGALQDVHWSAGLFGYFPTYSLGNLYAGQFFAQAQQDLGDQPAAFRRGEFQPLLDWLRRQIHRHGQRFPATELVHRVTGRPLSHAPWLEQMRVKYGDIYGL
jgi:carboxypeptidase Taq